MMADEAKVFSDTANKTVVVIVLFITGASLLRAFPFCICDTNAPFSSALFGILSCFAALNRFVLNVNGN